MLLALRQRISVLWGRISREGDSVADTWVIDANRAGFRDRVVEFWRFRRILWFFSVRQVTRMYEGTALGMFWLFARPLAPILISALIFGGLLKAPSAGLPYFLFFLINMTVWHLFDQSLLWATRSLDMNKGIIKKVYFPRLIIPASSASTALVNAALFSILLLSATVYYFWKDGTWYIRVAPATLLALLAGALSVVFGVGLGLWLSVWQVKYRDIRYGLRYFVRFWMYVTPVIYPLSAVPPDVQWLYFLNPMTAYVETFRWGLTGTGQFYGWPMFGSTAAILVVLAGGVWYFGKAEAASVDAM